MKTNSTRYTQPKRRKISQQVLVACLSMAGGLMAMPVMAQQAATDTSVGTLESVVVTARKHEEKMLDVPMSILAVSEKELHAAGITDLVDLKNSAGFNFNQNNGNSAAGRTGGLMIFRGMQSDTSFFYDQTGSLFIDGIFVSGGQSSVGMTDVQRVEVLKGPQNAFFGRSTSGGAVNLITKNPANKFQGKINVSGTSSGSSDMDATLEGPLVQDVVKGRLTLVNHNKAAPFKASDGGDLGAEKSQSVTGTLYITPNDNLWMRARMHYQQDDDSSSASTYLQGAWANSCKGVTFSGRDFFGAPTTFTPGVPYFCGTIPSMDQLGKRVVDANTIIPAAFQKVLADNTVNQQFFNDTPKLDHSGLRRDVLRLSFQGGYEFANKSELAFNIGYNDNKSTSAWDLDRSTVQNFYNALAVITKDLTVDARLSTDKKAKLRGLVGASYFKQKYQLSQNDYNMYLGPTTLPSANNASYFNYEIEVPAVYGSVEYDVLNNLTLSADMRYQRDKSTAFAYDLRTSYTNEVSNTLPRVSVTFKPNESTSIYASTSKGVQPLSLNGGYISATDAGKAYISSIVPGAGFFTPQPSIKSTEVGVKQRLFNDRMQYALTYYDQKWKDRTTNTIIFNPNSCTVAGIANTPACPLGIGGSGSAFGNDAHIRGIEFAVDAVVAKDWNAGLNLDYKDAKWDKYYYASLSSRTPGAAVLAGNAYFFDNRELGKVPKITAALNATYRRAAVFGDWNGYVRGDVVYTGEAWESDFNFAKTDSFYRVNLRAGLERKNVSLELFVKNLLNDNSWNFAARLANLAVTPLTSFSQQGVQVMPADPREVGIRASFSF